MAEYNVKKGDVAKVVEKSVKRIEDTGPEAAGKMWDSMRKMADDIRNVSLDKYKTQMMDGVDSARVELDKNVDQVKINIQDHPFESVAIAAGTGIVLGAVIALMGRNRMRRENRM